MKKHAVALVSAATLAFGAAPAVAGPELGTPGDPNCAGQTTALYASGVPGIGPLAREEGLSVQRVQTIFRRFCDDP